MWPTRPYWSPDVNDIGLRNGGAFVSMQVFFDDRPAAQQTGPDDPAFDAHLKTVATTLAGQLATHL